MKSISKEQNLIKSPVTQFPIPILQISVSKPQYLCWITATIWIVGHQCDTAIEMHRMGSKDMVIELGGSYLFIDKYQAQHRFAKTPLVAIIPKYNDLKEGPQYLENKICIFVNVETRR